MFGLRGSELLIVLLIVVVLFGSTRLPQLGSSMGAAIRNFKKGFGGEETPEDKPAANANLSATSSTPASEEAAKVSATRNG